MKRFDRIRVVALAVLFSLLVGARLAPAQARDEWYLQFMGDAKVGYEHEVVTQVEKGGRKLWRTEVEESIAINRLGTTIKTDVSSWMSEDENGQVLEEHAESNMSAQKSVKHLAVDGNRATLTVTTLGAPQVQTLDWKRQYLGPEAAHRAVHDKISGGAKEVVFEMFTLDSGAATYTEKSLGREKIDIPGKGKLELLHLQSTNSAQPGVVTDDWRDDDGRSRKISTRLMGLDFVSIPATRAECFAALANPDEPEIFSKVSPRSNVRLPAPRSLDELVLRVLKDPKNGPMPPLADERQTVLEKVSDQELVLQLRRVLPTEKFTLPLKDLTDDEKKHLERNAMIQSDDPEIVKLAKEAVGDETDAWKAACRIERFADRYITNKGYDKGFASASEVCRDKSGDCSEHGVFTAALCRAAGLPARVAVGLEYFGGGAWGGHMWTEVSLGSRWYAIDATLGRGGVDAAHLRLAADGLYDVGIEKVFANVALGMTMEIKALSYRHGNETVKIGAETKPFAVEGRRFHHVLYGLALEAPEDWKIVGNESTSIANTNVATFCAPDGHSIDVDVDDVTYDYTLDKVKDRLADRGVTRVKAEPKTIDGRPGLALRGKKGDRVVLVAAVLHDETLVLLQMETPKEDDAADFDEVVGSLHFDASEAASR